MHNPKLLNIQTVLLPTVCQLQFQPFQRWSSELHDRCWWESVRGWPPFHSKSVLKFFQLQPQTPLAFFGLQPPPSSRDALEYFLFWAPSSSPQHYCGLLPPQHLTWYPSKGCSETSASSKGKLETSSNSTPSDLNSAPMFSRYSWSCSRDGVAPAASDIKGCIIKVICDIKGWGWSVSVGNAGWCPWL